MATGWRPPTWKAHADSTTPPPGEVVAPGERLSWPGTAGIGTQHVVAVFGATLVFRLAGPRPVACAPVVATGGDARS